MPRPIQGVVPRVASRHRRRSRLAVRSLVWCAPVALALLFVGAPARLTAQAAPRYEQVFSANPFLLILLWFNAEYERTVSESSTLGVGGGYLSVEDDVTEQDEEYMNADLFWRFYPGARPFDGWAFGTKIGLTRIPEEGTFFGFGFDINRSWLLGANDNFYVGVGFGLKRLVGAGDRDLELEVIPTVRLVNIGWAF